MHSEQIAKIMTIYQGRVLDAVSLLPIPNVNLSISAGSAIDTSSQVSLPADINGQFYYVAQKAG
jgi:hypothetical protein